MHGVARDIATPYGMPGMLAHCMLQCVTKVKQIWFTLNPHPPPFQYCTGKRRVLETGNPTVFLGEGLVS